MAEVLITGASGFIGSRLAETLAGRDENVTCLVRKTSKLNRFNSSGVVTAYGDVTDAESLPKQIAGKSVVYHLAGCVWALKNEQFYRVNCDGTENVARACAEAANPPVLVVVSSLAAAGPSPRGRLLTEVDEPRPVSHYGRSKLAGEKAARAYADRVPITVVRPPAVIGKNDRYSLPWFQSVERFGVHLVACFTRYRLSIIHADDLVELLIHAAERGHRLRPTDPQSNSTDSEGLYLAACDEHPTHHQFGRMIGRALGHRRTLVLPFPSPLVWTVAGVSELIGQIRRTPAVVGVNKTREATAGSWACSAEKAARELGFHVAAPLDERLRQTAQWYRQEGWM